jgi:hypothetical protein
MRSRFPKLTVFISLLLLTASVGARAEPTKVDLKVTSGPNGLVATGVTDSQIIDITADGAALSISCTTDDMCTPIIAVVNGKPAVLSGTNPKTATLAADAISSAGTNVVVRKGAGGQKIIAFQLRNPSPGGKKAAPAQGASLACTPTPLPQTYDQDGNVAHFVVTPGGSILQRPDQPVDEDDVVIVHVYGDEPVVDKIEVARTSATRTTGTLSIAGAGQTPDLSRFDAEKLNCVERQFTLGDFAPGEATVEMYTIASGTKTTLGSFKFNVNTLYHGILSFGPVWTQQLGNETFKLAPSGTDKIIVASEEKDRNVIYAVAYTYYFLGRRDLEKSDSLIHHVNPTIAVAINNMSDHAMAGLSFDVGQIIITGGVHFAHVTRLSSASGLVPGSKFIGTDADIPTSKRWEHKLFLGVTVDLRAATALLKAVTGK